MVAASRAGWDQGERRVGFARGEPKVASARVRGDLFTCRLHQVLAEPLALMAAHEQELYAPLLQRSAMHPES